MFIIEELLYYISKLVKYFLIFSNKKLSRKWQVFANFTTKILMMKLLKYFPWYFLAKMNSSRLYFMRDLGFIFFLFWALILNFNNKPAFYSSHWPNICTKTIWLSSICWWKLSIWKNSPYQHNFMFIIQVGSMKIGEE